MTPRWVIVFAAALSLLILAVGVGFVVWVALLAAKPVGEDVPIRVFGVGAMIVFAVLAFVAALHYDDGSSRY